MSTVKAKPRLGAGNVEIELDGETVVLKPSLRAAQTLSRQNGGIVAVIESVSRLDFDVLIQVISLGLGIEPTSREAKDLPEKIWRTGIADLSAPAIRYLSILSNGGRPREDNGGGEEEGNPPSA